MATPNYTKSWNWFLKGLQLFRAKISVESKKIYGELHQTSLVISIYEKKYIKSHKKIKKLTVFFL